MINVLIDTAGFLLLVYSFLKAFQQLTFKPAPIKRTLGPERRTAVYGKK